MRAALRGIGVIGLAASTLTVPVAASSAAAPAANAGLTAVAPMTTPGAPADFGACMRGGGKADLLLLVDESSSLLESDPAQARVSSASYFVEQLAKSAGSDGAAIDIRIDVFAHGTEQIMPWTTLSEDGLDAVRQSISALGERVEGFDTDYWTALDGAQRTLKQKATAAEGAKRCQAVVMFTDGKLDYSPRLTAQEQQTYGTEKAFAPGVQLTSQQGADQVRQAAQDDICRAGGIADQMTASGISSYGIGLTTDPANQQEFDLFSSIMTGQGTAGGSCGTAGGGRGEFFLASDIDSLLLVFDRITGPEDPIEQEEGICQSVPCADRAHEFVLDTTTPEVRVLAQADVPGLNVSMLLPSGAKVDFPLATPGQAASAEAGGVRFEYNWETEKTISIEFAQDSAPASSWTGLWQLAFTDPSGQSGDKKSRSNIHIRGALVPGVEDADGLTLHAGDTASITPVLTQRDGSGFDAATILGSMNYRAVIIDAKGTELPVVETRDPAAMGTPVEVPLRDAAVGGATMRLTLGITTAPAKRPDGSPAPGTELEPVTVDLPVMILPPAEFPVLGDSIDFGSGTGAVTLQGTLDVSGSGCAWIAQDAAPQITAAPEGLGAVSLTAPGHGDEGSCLQAGSGPLQVTFSTEHGGNGSVNGTVPVMIGPADGSAEPMRVDVPFTADLQNPLNTLNFLLVLIAAPLLGIGLPLLLLYLAKWRISRIPPRPLAAARIPVRSEHGQLLRDGVPFELKAADMRGTVPIPASGARSLTIGEVTLRARIGLSPAGPGFVEIDAPGSASASGADPASDKTGLRARLPLAVHGNWIVLHRDGAPAGEATLLVLIGGDAAQAEREELSRSIARRAPGVLEGIVRARGETGQAPAEQPVPAGSPFQQGQSSSSQGQSPFQPHPGQQFGQPGPGASQQSPFQDGPPSGGSPWGTG